MKGDIAGVEGLSLPSLRQSVNCIRYFGIITCFVDLDRRVPAWADGLCTSF